MGTRTLRRERLVWRLGECLAYGAFSYPERAEQGARWLARARALCRALELPPPPALPDERVDRALVGWLYARLDPADPPIAALAADTPELVDVLRCSLLVLPYGLTPPDQREAIQVRLLELGRALRLDGAGWAARVASIDAQSVHDVHDQIDRELGGGPLRGADSAHTRLLAWRLATAATLAAALRLVIGEGEALEAAQKEEQDAAALAAALQVAAPPEASGDAPALRGWVLEGPLAATIGQVRDRHGPDSAALMEVAARLLLLRQESGPQLTARAREALAALLPPLGEGRVHPGDWRPLLALIAGEPDAARVEALADAALEAIAARLLREAQGDESPTHCDPPARLELRVSARRWVYELGFDLAQAAMLAGIGEHEAAQAMWLERAGAAQALFDLPPPPPLPEASLLDEPAAAAVYVLGLRESELGQALAPHGTGLPFLLVTAGELGLLCSPLTDTWPPEIQAKLRDSIVQAGRDEPGWSSLVALAERREAQAVRDHAAALREAEPGPVQRLHATALGLNMVAAAALRLDGREEQAAAVEREIEHNAAALDVPVPPPFQSCGDPRRDAMTFALHTAGPGARAAADVERVWGASTAALVRLTGAVKLLQLILPAPGSDDWQEGLPAQADAIALHAQRAGLPPALWAAAVGLPEAATDQAQARGVLGALLEGTLALYR